MEEVFGETSKYDMHLNLEKCTFGISDKIFLGFMITYWGIEANLDKCTAILEIHSLTNIREVQKLNGRLASLSKFLPKLAKKAKPFYMLLRKIEPFLWDDAYKQAFLAFKKTITTPLVLSQPKP